MDFFKLPEPGDYEDDQGFEDPTAPYVAVPLSCTQVVARNEDVAILISSAYAYPDGLEMKVVTHVRGSAEDKFQQSLRGPDLFMGDDGSVADTFLRVGVAYSDGRKATNLEFPWNRRKEKVKPTCGLDSHGGGGSGDQYEHNFWVWPLPTDGEFKVVFEWRHLE